MTHLTPPFMEGGLYEGLRPLRDRLDRYRNSADGPVRAEHARTIRRMAVDMDLHVDLGLDPEKAWSDDDYFRLSNHVETIDGAKVVQGFYTLGNAFSDGEVHGTAELMAIDPIAYGLAGIDIAKGAVESDILDDVALFERRYRQTARRAYARRAAGESVDAVLADLVSPADLEKAHGESKLAQPFLVLKAGVAGVDRHRKGLRDSSDLELESVVRGLGGGYVEPSPGGDPIVNPDAVPTGRNLFSIDAEQTPSREAWTVGRRLAESLIDEHRRRHDAYPKKVAFTLWPTDFIGTEGATIGEIFYLLGVEPVWDPRGRVGHLRLIPSADLGRPRIDVVVQTAGQLRDLAASRLALINRAVAMAAEARDAEANFVQEGRLRAEEVMMARGLSPADARRYSTLRVFGGVNGNYGTAIMGMVESGDRWEEDSEVADQYIRNMGAVYDEGELWSFYAEGLFEAALAGTEVVVQPRQSHTWGALSLDHVYEFMGGLSAAVRHVTGRDADAYFNDFRNMNRPRVTDLEETIWTEARSTLLNPAYIGEMQEGGASSAEHFAETFRNTYGWNVMKPAAIDDTLWNELYEVYVDDRYDLGVHDFFRRENPYALQEMTAVMLETARKGLWEATAQQLAVLAELHTRLVEEFEAGCSGFVCDNAALASFIAEQAPAELAASYRSEPAAGADDERGADGGERGAGPAGRGAAAGGRGSGPADPVPRGVAGGHHRHRPLRARAARPAPAAGHGLTRRRHGGGTRRRRGDRGRPVAAGGGVHRSALGTGAGRGRGRRRRLRPAPDRGAPEPDRVRRRARRRRRPDAGRAARLRRRPRLRRGRPAPRRAARPAAALVRAAGGAPRRNHPRAGAVLRGGEGVPRGVGMDLLDDGAGAVPRRRRRGPGRQRGHPAGAAGPGPPGRAAPARARGPGGAGDRTDRVRAAGGRAEHGGRGRGRTPRRGRRRRGPRRPRRLLEPSPAPAPPRGPGAMIEQGHRLRPRAAGILRFLEKTSVDIPEPWSC